MPSVRVWAEARDDDTLLLTWEWQEESAAERDRAADARAIAATIGVRPGVRSARPAEDGVLVAYDPAITGKPELAASLRLALAQEGDLKARANALLKRVPTYANLARTLALDERISPVPEVARAAATRRRSPAAMIPGVALITRVQALIPVLRSLSTWSRTAEPGVVEQHLANVGLTREQLDLDLATSQEAILYARDISTQTAGRVARRASSLASQAASASREYIDQRRQPSPPARHPGDIPPDHRKRG